MLFVMSRCLLSLCLLALLATTTLAVNGRSAFPKYRQQPITPSTPAPTTTTTTTTTTAPSLPHIRPPPSQRKFNSTAVNSLIATYTSQMIDPDLATLFENCLPCTLDTTVGYFTPRNASSVPDTYVITGDIDAQWLRDSTNQVLPYIALAANDTQLTDLICGLIKRQSRDITHDPYANSFNFDNTGGPHQDDNRRPAMTPLVFEGKYELDSLAAALKLAYYYYRDTQDMTCLTEDSVWLDAVSAILATMTDQQQSTLPPSTAPYYFQRTTSAPTDSLMLGGVGNVGRYTGMVKSAFRPSDDSTLFPFFIPANAMAVVELRHVSELLTSLVNRGVSSVQRAVMVELANNASILADTIDAAIQRYGVIQPPRYLQDELAATLGPAAPTAIYAYEVDGYGGQTIMDDANIPSLLALPYLGYTSRTDPLYVATRAVLLSSNNPYFFNGTAGSGIGGPHIGLDYIWPMSLIARALTSTSDEEIVYCLSVLKASSAGTGWLHESFEKDSVETYTRPWFAWVNGLYGQLIMQLAVERPHLIFKQAMTE